MKVLIACEESQTVTKEFRKLGFEAYSCDIQPCTGGKPEWHIEDDIFKHIDKGWDLMIAHPPCTYLAVSGAKWFYHPDDKGMPIENRRPHPKFPNRKKHQKEALAFFKKLATADIPYVAVENPISVVSSKWRKPDQIVQPYMFGDEATKTTCLWLKNLPDLEPTKLVGKGERVYFKSGKSQPKWYSDALSNSISSKERQILRSKTFKGFAKAMANQWGNYVLEELKSKK